MPEQDEKSDTSIVSCCSLDKHVDRLRSEHAARLLTWHALARRISEELRRGSPSALDTCQRATNQSVPTLRRWAFAGRRLSSSAIADSANWRDSSGRSLSIPHLVELARFTATRRKAILDAMQGALWPVVRLRAATRPKGRVGGTGTPE